MSLEDDIQNLAKLAMHPLAGAALGGVGGYALGKALGKRDPQQLALLGALGGGGLAHYMAPAEAAAGGAAQQLIPRSENAAAQAAAVEGREALEAVAKRPPASGGDVRAMEELKRLQQARRGPSPELQAMANRASQVPADPPPMTPPPDVPINSVTGSARPRRNRGSFGEAKTGSTKLALDMSHPVLGPLLRNRLRDAV